MKNKISLAEKGKIISQETRLKRSIATKGEKSCHWKGGLTSKNRRIRHSFEYRMWRKKVFERDNYTCQMCFKMSKEIHADHIKPFALYPDLRFCIDNGRTLCKKCHEKTDTYGGHFFKNLPQLLLETSQ